MADNNENQNTGCNFKEAVCIDVGRVYDSCCDRDCVEDLRCYFSEEAQCEIDDAINVKIKNAEVLNVFVDVDHVSFNRGFYTCDLTFLFRVMLEVYNSPSCSPKLIQGVCCFSKKVILFGSEGNVKIFSNRNGACFNNKHNENRYNAPKCVVQTVEPVALSARLGVVDGCKEAPGTIPETVAEYLGDSIANKTSQTSRTVYVTLGLFSVVQLIRNVQMLVPVYDFCVPEKQCTDTTDQPCDVFKKIKFPTNDFFPPDSCPNDCGCQ